MDTLNKFKFYLAYLIVFSSYQFSFGQEDITKLSFDSLSLEEILKLQNDALAPSFKFDSVQIELYFKGERFAIVPGNLRNEINSKYIISSKYETQILADKRTLLRILFELHFK